MKKKVKIKNIVIRSTKVIGNIIIAVAIMLLAQFISGLIILPSVWLTDMISAIFYIIIALGIGLPYAKYVLHFKPEDLGVRRKLPELRWIIIGLILPISISAIYLFLIKGQLVRNDRLSAVSSTIIYAIFVPGIGAGIVEEFIFRGVIMRVTERCFGKINSVVLPSLLFGVAHLMFVDLREWNAMDILLVSVGGTLVGLMFSLIAYQSETIWSSAVVHGIWNSIIVGGILEIGSVSYGMGVNSIWYYKIASHNIFLTGGRFGIEVAIPAVIGYTIICISTIIFLKKELSISASVGKR